MQDKNWILIINDWIEGFFATKWGWILMAAIAQLTVVRDNKEKLKWYHAIGIVASAFMLGYAVMQLLETTEYAKWSVLAGSMIGTFSIPVLSVVRLIIVEIGSQSKQIVGTIIQWANKKFGK